MLVTAYKVRDVLMSFYFVGFRVLSSPELSCVSFLLSLMRALTPHISLLLLLTPLPTLLLIHC